MNFAHECYLSERKNKIVVLILSYRRGGLGRAGITKTEISYLKQRAQGMDRDASTK